MSLSLLNRPFRFRPLTAHPPHRGFTVPELLAVVAIIVILLSILMPSLGQGREGAWRAQCASNQHQIHIALKNANQMVSGFKRIPGVGSWIGFVGQQKAQAALLCPKGKHMNAEIGDGLEEVYSVQVSGGKTTYSWVRDIKAGKLATDPQLNRVWQGTYMGTFGESPKTWLETVWGKSFSNNEMGVGYDNDAGYVVQFGSQFTTIHSLDAPGDKGIGSNHWVAKGLGGTAWKSEIIMQLTGGAYVDKVDPPVQLGSSHYGMNNQVSDAKHRGSQILLMDYQRTIIRLGATKGSFADDFDKMFAPRHFDQANVLFVDGHVELMPRGKLNATEPIWYPE